MFKATLKESSNLDSESSRNDNLSITNSIVCFLFLSNKGAATYFSIAPPSILILLNPP